MQEDRDKPKESYPEVNNIQNKNAIIKSVTLIVITMIIVTGALIGTYLVTRSSKDVAKGAAKCGMKIVGYGVKAAKTLANILSNRDVFCAEIGILIKEKKCEELKFFQRRQAVEFEIIRYRTIKSKGREQVAWG